MLLSIVIPVYNVQKYIKRCLESCQQVAKYLDEFEILIINDGSTDNSIEIAQTIIKGKKNIRIINKINGGLSSARNVGLDHTKGEYVWFVDSDDYINPDIILNFLNITKIHPDLEIISFYTETVTEEIPQYIQIYRRNLPINKKIAGCQLYFADYRYPYSGVPFYLYKRKFLISNNLKFKEGLVFEDLLFTAMCLAKAEKTIYLDDLGYYYLLRKGSITHSAETITRSLQLLEIMDDMYAFLNQLNCPQQRKVIYDSFSRALCVLYRYQYLNLKKEDKEIIYSELKKRNYVFTCVRKSQRLKYLVFYMLLRLKL